MIQTTSKNRLVTCSSKSNICIQQSDYLIIGAGIVGLSIARELKQRYPEATVVVLEKESGPGFHSSGRNSGVLHSGIYYPAGSLKATVCGQGANELAEFCVQYHLPLERRGKILVATRENDTLQLQILAERAHDNGIHVEELDEQTLKTLEPEVRSVTGKALFVSSTAVGSPKAVMQAMLGELDRLGIEIRCNAKIVQINVEQRRITLKNGDQLGYGHAINAAGLCADTIAHLFHIGHRYTLLPFKGLYWKLDPNAGVDVRHLIYPVPDLRVPFLGVHTTTTTDGITYLGPTAVPAFGRENYRGLQDVNPQELMRITSLLVKQFAAGRDGFRRLAWQEGRRYFKPWFVKAAQSILPRLKSEHLLPTDKVGIRAQVLDRQTGGLVNDFLVERGQNSTHILNAISPAWTSTFPFARYVCDNYIEKN